MIRYNNTKVNIIIIRIKPYLTYYKGHRIKRLKPQWLSPFIQLYANYNPYNIAYDCTSLLPWITLLPAFTASITAKTVNGSPPIRPVIAGPINGL